jgi:hypothetical protein
VLSKEPGKTKKPSNTNNTSKKSKMEIEEIIEEQSAKAELRLYSQHDGVPGNPVENWYVRNLSSSQAIRFTVEFWRGQIVFGDRWTRTFDIEPGEIKGIGSKRSSGMATTINARIVGARYLN